MERSVERVDGVKTVKFDLNTGWATVAFETGKIPSPAELWKAVERSGFTPAKIEYDGKVYEGPEH